METYVWNLRSIGKEVATLRRLRVFRGSATNATYSVAEYVAQPLLMIAATPFLVHRLGLSPALMRCLTSTNIIESSHSGVRLRTRRICRWRDGRMVLRWAAAAFLITEKSFRKIQGYRDLWMLKAVLNPTAGKNQVHSMEQVA